MAKENKDFVKEITPQSEDFSRWYIDVIKKADLMDVLQQHFTSAELRRLAIVP